MLGLRFWRWSFALIASPVVALSVELPITDRSGFDLDAGLRRAVIQVAEQLTGIGENQLLTEDPALLSLPESLVFSYGFTESGFLVDVDDAALKTRLARAAIALWDAVRPETLIWLTEEVGLERRMTFPEDSALAPLLRAQSARFDVPFRFVLMDLEDQLALSPAEIWGGFVTAVTSASARYGIDWVMVLGDRPVANATRYWLYQDGRKVMDTMVTGPVEERMMQITQDLLARLRTRSTVEAVPSEPPIMERVGDPMRVRLVELDTVGLLELLAILEADPRVRRIAPIVLTGDEASLSVEGALDGAALADLLRTTAGLVQLESGQYRWQ